MQIKMRFRDLNVSLQLKDTELQNKDAELRIKQKQLESMNKENKQLHKEITEAKLGNVRIYYSYCMYTCVLMFITCKGVYVYICS